MSKSKIDLKEIRELMKLAEQNKLDKFVVKQGDFELHLERHAPSVAAPAAAPRALPSQPSVEPQKSASEVVGRYVTSPMVGTFYAAPSPDKPPFVQVGDRVEAHQVICIIEAMKVMNEVKAGISGIIAEILIDTAHPVEFGSKLVRIT